LILGQDLTEGNLNNAVDGDVPSSFAWRGGYERMTTGIWMWSEPFIVHSSEFNEDIAVLLMDTQGMFDNQTSMTLTAQIFGLSTLISSFQVSHVVLITGCDLK
jgi:atlastin